MVKEQNKSLQNPNAFLLRQKTLWLNHAIYQLRLHHYCYLRLFQVREWRKYEEQRDF